MTTRVNLSGLGRARAPSFGGVSGIGSDATAGLRFAGNAVVAPQFNAGRAGRYALDVVVVGVPIASNKSPFFDVGEWNDALEAGGYAGVVVEGVEFVNTGDAANPRSTGGSLDIFGWGEPIADYTYRLTISVAEAGGGVSGVGTITTLGWIAIGAAVVAINLLIYKLSGTDCLVTAVRWLGQLVGVAAGAAGGAVATGLLPVLAIAAVALLAFTKMGGRGSYKGFSIGGGR